MPKHYQARVAGEREGLVTVEVGFGEPAQNDAIVPDAIEALAGLSLAGGRGILFNGPASIPVAMALSHAVAHLYQFVACFDPKLGGYVVVISHAAEPRPGDVVAGG